MVSDISLRVFKDNQLKRSESFLKQAEMLTKAAHFEIDIESGKMVWSDHMFRTLNEELDQGQNKFVRDALDYVHPEDKKLVLDTYFNCIRTHQPIDIRFRVIVDEGNILYVHNIGVLNNIDESGHLHTIFSTVKDITREYQNEEELRSLNMELESRVVERTKQLEQNQFLYKLIARNFPNGTISVFDKDLNYVFVEGKELYRRKITGEMLIGTSFLDRVDPDIREDIKEKLMCVCGGERESINFELNTRDKTYMINAVCLQGSVEENNHILMVSQNITSLKKAENDIHTALKKEQHLNELKTRFVSTASHEFRTPMTSILNSTSLLEKYLGTTGNEDRQKKHIERIKSSTKHLITILNDFLSIDKIEQGDFELTLSNVDITDKAERMIGEMDAILKDGQSILFTHEGSNVCVTDKHMLAYIFSNLLSNAIKYSDADKVIKLKTKVDDENIHIEVTDQGIGIPKEEQHNLFTRFFRAKNADNIQGTGLGLTIINNYISKAGGKIDFESNENVGTIFTITLPNTNT